MTRGGFGADTRGAALSDSQPASGPSGARRTDHRRKGRDGRRDDWCESARGAGGARSGDGTAAASGHGGRARPRSGEKASAKGVGNGMVAGAGEGGVGHSRSRLASSGATRVTKPGESTPPAAPAADRARHLPHSQSPIATSAARIGDATVTNDDPPPLPGARPKAMAGMTPIETTCQKQSKSPREESSWTRFRKVRVKSLTVAGHPLSPAPATGRFRRASKRGARLRSLQPTHFTRRLDRPQACRRPAGREGEEKRKRETANRAGCDS